MGQFDWTPDEYLERIRSKVPRYDELQEQAVAAIPFSPDRVLELGMGTGETTRRLIDAYPDAWVVGLDASPDMVFRARQTYDDVQLARMEDPLPDGPWDLVISVLSIGELSDEQKQALFRRVREQSRSLVIGEMVEGEDLENLSRVVGRRGQLGRGGTGRGASGVQLAHLPWVVDRSRGAGVLATIPRPMAVPKKRTSSARRDKRRANHKAGEARLNRCPRCHSPRLPHRVCPTCGTYKGREVIDMTVTPEPTTGAPDAEE